MHMFSGLTLLKLPNVSPSPPKAPVHPWEWLAQPWSRLHLDFAGPFLGHMYLILVDAYSKWLTVEVMNSITAEKTIQKLRTIFAAHGIPHKIVTDNGPTFRSEQFQTFVMHNTYSLRPIIPLPTGWRRGQCKQ